MRKIAIVVLLWLYCVVCFLACLLGEDPEETPGRELDDNQVAAGSSGA
ncbi:MAG: hypothetical protein WCX27_02560 [Candidatus Paceibacterota bacterium]|jgi:hypothetical protein